MSVFAVRNFVEETCLRLFGNAGVLHRCFAACTLTLANRRHRLVSSDSTGAVLIPGVSFLSVWTPIFISLFIFKLWFLLIFLLQN